MPKTTQDIHRLYAVLVLLSCQQYMAVSFLYGAVPAILRSKGVNLIWIGLFGLVFIAFTINVFWAPLIDRQLSRRLGRRRSWMLLTQLCCIALMLLGSLLDPARQVEWLLAFGIALAGAAATQRIATQAYATEQLAAHHRAKGAAVMGWGVAVGNAIGAAAGLLAVTHYGWTATLAGGALLTAVMSLALILIRETSTAGLPQPQPLLAELRQSLMRPGIVKVILTMAPSTAGVALAFAMCAPWLVDLGLSLPQVGAVMALATVAAYSTAGPLMGRLLQAIAAQRIIAFSAMVVTPLLLAALLAYWLLPGRTGTLCAILAVFCAIAMQSVAFNAYFYASARPGHAATDVTVLNAAMSLAAIAGFAASGWVAAHLGYAATLLCALGGYVITAALVQAGLRHVGPAQT